MPPRHDGTDGTEPDSTGVAAALQGAVESVSIRVLLNGGARECRACEATIASGTRYRCLTVRDGDGAVSEVCFCGDECAGSFADSRIAPS
jgi:hypothetical protein